MTALRLGLCCTFQEQPIQFRTTTVTATLRQPRDEQLRRLSALCRDNALALMASLEYCHAHGIGCFRINSQILPLKTHAQVGYTMRELPEGREIVQLFEACGAFAAEHGLRTCFHPDQFVVLNSPRDEVVASSIAELDYQAEVAEWVGADVLNIHGGGAYGDKPAAVKRFAATVKKLTARVRRRLTIENDDRVYTPSELLPLCERAKIPLVYDVHHHRCLPDGLSVEEATAAARQTWGKREPLFHISSPLDGWQGKDPRRHHDFIDLADFPREWLGQGLTVEVEAKAKEVAVGQLLAALSKACPPRR